MSKPKTVVTPSPPSPSSADDAASSSTSLGGCLLRAYWMILGNAFLLLSAYGIFEKRDGFLSASDAVFWGVAASLMVVRFIDVYKLKGLTGAGQPATPSDFRRYALWLAVGAVCLWGLAHAGARLAG